MKLKILGLSLLFVSLLGVHGWGDEPKPGESVAGLQLTVTTDEPTWEPGMTKEFQMILKNVDDKPVLIDTFGKFDEVYSFDPKMHPTYGNWEVGMEDAQGRRQGVGPGFVLMESVIRQFSKDQFVRLEPDQTYVKRLTYTLRRAGSPHEVLPGHYLLKVSYHPASEAWTSLSSVEDESWIGVQHWTGSIVSNLLPIEVKRRAR